MITEENSEARYQSPSEPSGSNNGSIIGNMEELRLEDLMNIPHDPEAAEALPEPETVSQGSKEAPISEVFASEWERQAKNALRESQEAAQRSFLALKAWHDAKERFYALEAKAETPEELEELNRLRARIFRLKKRAAHLEDAARRFKEVFSNVNSLQNPTSHPLGKPGSPSTRVSGRYALPEEGPRYRILSNLLKWDSTDLKSTQVDRFLRKVELNLKVNRVPQHVWVGVLRTLVDDNTETWLSEHCEGRPWETVREEFIKYYSSPYMETERYNELLDLTMKKGEAVAVFSDRFLRGMVEAGVPLSNGIMITRYLRKIPKGLAGRVQGTRFLDGRYHPFKSIKEAMNTAKALSALFELGEDPLAPRKRSSDTQDASPTKLFCSHCKRAGHRTADCRKKARLATQDSLPSTAGVTASKSAVKCFNCGLTGHYANKCTRPKKAKEAPNTSVPRVNNTRKRGRKEKKQPTVQNVRNLVEVEGNLLEEDPTWGNLTGVIHHLRQEEEPISPTEEWEITQAGGTQQGEASLEEEHPIAEIGFPGEDIHHDSKKPSTRFDPTQNHGPRLAGNWNFWLMAALNGDNTLHNQIHDFGCKTMRTKEQRFIYYIWSLTHHRKKTDFDVESFVDAADDLWKTDASYMPSTKFLVECAGGALRSWQRT